MKNNEFRADAVHFKVVELSTVTDETIENVLNEWTARSWHFDQIQFVVREASRRPSMAFMFFTKAVQEGEIPQYDRRVIKSEDDKEECDIATNEEEGEIEWN